MMKISLRIIGVLILSALLTVSLTACGSGGGGGDDTTSTDRFAGTYNIPVEYELNITSGVALQAATYSLTITRNSTDELTAEISNDNQTASFTLNESGNIAKIPNVVNGSDSNTLQFLVMSDGNNMALIFSGQEKDDLDDISFTLSAWQRTSSSVTIDDFVGTWNINSYGHVNLRNTDEDYEANNYSIDISKTDSDTISVIRGTETFTLQVSGSRATLTNAPVTTSDSIMHAFTIVCDGTRIALYHAATELDDLTDVSVSVGLGTK